MKKILLILLFLPMIGFAQNPNYSEDIAPIIYGKCLQCHYSGGIAPLSLETYADAVLNAGLMQHVVSTGEMPPWPPDTAFQRFSYENILSFDEITIYYNNFVTFYAYFKNLSKKLIVRNLNLTWFVKLPFLIITVWLYGWRLPTLYCLIAFIRQKVVCTADLFFLG